MGEGEGWGRIRADDLGAQPLGGLGRAGRARCVGRRLRPRGRRGVHQMGVVTVPSVAAIFSDGEDGVHKAVEPAAVVRQVYGVAAGVCRLAQGQAGVEQVQVRCRQRRRGGCGGGGGGGGGMAPVRRPPAHRRQPAISLFFRPRPRAGPIPMSISTSIPMLAAAAAAMPLAMSNEDGLDGGVLQRLSIGVAAVVQQAGEPRVEQRHRGRQVGPHHQRRRCCRGAGSGGCSGGCRQWRRGGGGRAGGVDGGRPAPPRAAWGGRAVVPSYRPRRGGKAQGLRAGPQRPQEGLVCLDVRGPPPTRRISRRANRGAP